MSLEQLLPAEEPQFCCVWLFLELLFVAVEVLNLPIKRTHRVRRLIRMPAKGK